tara:strand:- start:223 stop:1866 length:1644 start_codon:yes stop_codon:yes gene_type:complete
VFNGGFAAGGVGSFADGSASAPSITNTGDVNTGIFFPAADTIGFAEGGAEAARFDSSGRLLIGSTASQENNHRLQITGGDQATSSISVSRLSADQYGAHIEYLGTRSTSVGSNTIVQANDTLGLFIFRGDDGTNFATEASSIFGEVDGTPGENDMPGRLVFKTTADGAATGTERLRINNAGDVTIGNAASARARLEVYDSGVSAAFVAGTLSTWRVMQVRNNIESATGTAAGIAFGGDGSSDTETAGIVGISDNSTGGVVQLGFLTATGNNSIEAMRIDSDQRLLIGHTSSPTDIWGGQENALQVIGNSWPTTGLGLHNYANDTTSPNISFSKSRNGTVGTSGTIVQDGDRLGFINFAGDDGTDIAPSGGAIDIQVDGTPGANDMPGRMLLRTASDGSSTTTERVKITSKGAMNFDSGSAAIHAMRVSTGAGAATDCFEIDNSGSGTFACYIDVVTNQNGGYAGNTSQFLWHGRRASAGNSRGVVQLSNNSLGSVNSGVVAIGTITAGATNPTGTLERFQITTQYATDSIYCIIRAVGNINSLKILN